MFCTGFEQQFSATIVPTYLYYSHIPISIISLILGFTVWRLGDRKKTSAIFFSLTLAFFTLFFSNIFLWLAVDANIQTFAWFLTQFVFLLLPLLSFLLFLEFSGFNEKNQALSNVFRVLILILCTIFIPIVLLGYNINYFDLYNCTVVEANFIVIYQNSVLILSCLSMAYLAIKNIYSGPETRESSVENALFATGLCFVLASLFFTWNPLIFGYSEGIEQFGFIGAIIFLAIITYMIVRFHAFNIKLFSTQVLVWGLATLIGSQFFFIKQQTNFILNGFGFIAAIVLGRYLIKSIKKEMKLREDLEVANKGQESLMHAMNHQIKGVLSKAKNIFAELLESDDYGHIPEEAKSILKAGLESTDEGVDYVQGILKGAKSGVLSYDMKPLDLKPLVSTLVLQQKDSAEKSPFKLTFESHIADGDYCTIGDETQLREAFKNLITNAIKYNKQGGSITVSMSRLEQKILFSVKDTGRGMTKETERRLYTPGGMGEDSMRYNPDASGFGLAFVRPVIQKHGGKIWYQTEVGKGTTFFVELPLK